MATKLILDFNTNRYIDIILTNNNLILKLLPLIDYQFKTRIVHLTLHHPEFESWDNPLSGDIFENYNGPHNVTFELTTNNSAEIWTENGTPINIQIPRYISKKLIFLWDGARFIHGLNAKNILLSNE
jgi:hypothetical protein